MRCNCTSPLLLFVLLVVLIDSPILGQNRAGRPSFRISGSQPIYTEYSANVWDLDPYEKKSQETLGSQVIQVIERGNYRIETSEAGLDTLGFWVEEWRIEGTDTLYTNYPIELRKTS
ncbi:MAG: hypothetical protein AAFU60_13760, partial [Bacteroidota bacterium]